MKVHLVPEFPLVLNSKNTIRQSFIFFLPTLTACTFGTTGSSETLCTSFERSDQWLSGAKEFKGVKAILFTATAI